MFSALQMDPRRDSADNAGGRGVKWHDDRTLGHHNVMLVRLSRPVLLEMVSKAEQHSFCSYEMTPRLRRPKPLPDFRYESHPVPLLSSNVAKLWRLLPESFRMEQSYFAASTLSGVDPLREHACCA
jgi:hypothetical protein